jgi:hypothetical protein
MSVHSAFGAIRDAPLLYVMRGENVTCLIGTGPLAHTRPTGAESGYSALRSEGNGMSVAASLNAALHSQTDAIAPLAQLALTQQSIDGRVDGRFKDGTGAAEAKHAANFVRELASREGVSLCEDC